MIMAGATEEAGVNLLYYTAKEQETAEIIEMLQMTLQSSGIITGTEKQKTGSIGKTAG